MKKTAVFCFLFLLSGIAARACDSCHCTLSREAVCERAAHEGPHLFADFTIEQMNWDALPASDAHRLHHQGHHVHDKTHEELYHFTLGASPADSLTILAELPYVVRGSIEIHDHARLGKHETSEGLGDLSLTGIWRFVQEKEGVLGWLGGVKLPTGETEKTNSGGELFESELQPGTGSTDATIGIVGRRPWGPADLRANVRYTKKGKGDHGFRFGDVFAAHLAADGPLWKNDAFFAKLGASLDWQSEARQSENGERVEDSGGDTLLAGPTLELDWGAAALFGNFLFPVYQNLGGVHQELDFVWNAGVKINW